MDAMFCYQCSDALGGKGCTRAGVCGKKPEVAKLQDLLIYVTKGISAVTTRLRDEGQEVKTRVNRLVTLNLFATITNANFDAEALTRRIEQTLLTKSKLLAALTNSKNLPEAATWSAGREDFLSKAEVVGVLSTANEDVRSLRELVTYGLKGIAAYMKHANRLNFEDEKIDAFIQRALSQLLDDGLSVAELTALALETGKFGVDVMALLDSANTKTYGNPEATKVFLGVRKNPAILISGHDLRDLEQLLEQTAGTGVDVYTHGEMLPAHYYPKLKKFPHLVGNYGNAWQNQTTEFEKFNGAILLTTNCLMPPKESYRSRVFTTGAVGYPGCKHIDEIDGLKDFSELIEVAKKCSSPTELESGELVGGFAHEQIFAVADKVVEAVKSGAIRKFVVMAGCDGRQKSRDYYTKFAESLPKDAVILTAGCAKYKYIKLNLGDIGGIPRVLDAGQCNDCYSLAVVALKLKEIFGLDDVNKLPLVFNIGWHEQKAVTVLLALLYLGVKNIHLGPVLPAFLSRNVTKVLVEQFGIGTITNVEDDLKTMLA